MTETPPPGTRRLPFSLITKPTGAACNLDCSYCFFLSKEVLWGHESQQMTAEMLEGSSAAIWMRSRTAE